MNLWVDHVRTTPGTVCEDAFSESSRGQSGWDLGLHFRDLNDLAMTLEEYRFSGAVRFGRMERIVPLSVQRLSIHCHGIPGKFFCDDAPTPVGDPPNLGLSAARFSFYGAALRRIGNFLAPSATVFLMGCSAGATVEGSALLNALSSAGCWPQRIVVGFTVVGRAGDTVRQGANCSEPGMRLGLHPSTDTGSRMVIGSQPNLALFPWADENHQLAKVSFRGHILRGDDGPRPHEWYGWGGYHPELPSYVPDPLPGDLDGNGRPTGPYLARWGAELRRAGIIPPREPAGPMFWPFGRGGSGRVGRR